MHFVPMEARAFPRYRTRPRVYIVISLRVSCSSTSKRLLFQLDQPRTSWGWDRWEPFLSTRHGPIRKHPLPELHVPSVDRRARETTWSVSATLKRFTVVHSMTPTRRSLVLTSLTVNIACLRRISTSLRPLAFFHRCAVPGFLLFFCPSCEGCWNSREQKILPSGWVELLIICLPLAFSVVGFLTCLVIGLVKDTFFNSIDDEVEVIRRIRCKASTAFRIKLIAFLIGVENFGWNWRWCSSYEIRKGRFFKLKIREKTFLGSLSVSLIRRKSFVSGIFRNWSLSNRLMIESLSSLLHLLLSKQTKSFHVEIKSFPLN